MHTERFLSRRRASIRTSTLLACCLGIANAFSLNPAPSAESLSGSRLSVDDLTRVARFGDPGTARYPDHSGENPIAVVSPNGKLAAAVMRYGDPQRHVNIGELLLIRDSDVWSGRSPIRLTSAISETNNQPMSQVRWLDDSNIVLAVANGNEPSTVEIVNVANGNRKRIAGDDADLDWYLIDQTHRRLLTVSTAKRQNPFDAPACGRAACRVEASSLFEAIGVRGASVLFRNYDLKTHESARLPALEEADPDADSCPPWLVGGYSTASLSPNGRYALRVCAVREDRIPKWWTEYSAIPSLQKSLHDGASLYSAQFYLGGGALFLLDLSDNLSTRLSSAPYFSSGVAPIWIEGGRRFILVGALEPLIEVAPAERERRRRDWSLLAIDPQTKSAERIGTLGPDVESVVSATWDAKASTLSVKSRQAGTPGSIEISRYTKSPAGWRRVHLTAARHTINDGAGTIKTVVLASGTRLMVSESINDPPRLVAISRDQSRRVVLSDPNAWIRGRSKGRVEPISGIDALGRAWEGGLMYPPEFKRGDRYPVLLQTHGFEKNVFSPHGVSVNFPGQALAAFGVIVLSVDEGGRDLEGAKVEYESAIDDLQRRGLIDPTKVGVIGWSRSGTNLAYLLTHTSRSYAAAAFADTGGFGYWWYMMESPLIQRTFEEDYGGAPFGPGLDAWRKTTPDFNLERNHAPTLMWEAGSPVGLWDWYSGMKHFNVPVEMWVLKNGAHEVRDIDQQIQTNQLFVDWFRFWLRGEEDTDAAKTEQYRRWRNMKASAKQQESATAAH